jgi:2,4-dienoyl-CoA reductase-like NADH-dependent reductase (Old Yellow Enzyme family)
MEDTYELVKILAQKKLDYLHVSTMDYWGASLRNNEDKRPRTKLISEKVGHLIPIIGVGGVSSPNQAIKILENGVPLVALARELLIEPHWLEKIKNENELEIEKELDRTKQADLVIPNAMWKLITTREGWLPLKK